MHAVPLTAVNQSVYNTVGIIFLKISMNFHLLSLIMQFFQFQQWKKYLHVFPFLLEKVLEAMSINCNVNYCTRYF